MSPTSHILLLWHFRFLCVGMCMGLMQASTLICRSDVSMCGFVPRVRSTRFGLFFFLLSTLVTYHRCAERVSLGPRGLPFCRLFVISALSALSLDVFRCRSSRPSGQPSQLSTTVAVWYSVQRRIHIAVEALDDSLCMRACTCVCSSTLGIFIDGEQAMARHMMHDESWEALVLGAIDCGKTGLINLVRLDNLRVSRLLTQRGCSGAQASP
jgi:hypothetical protein